MALSVRSSHTEVRMVVAYRTARYELVRTVVIVELFMYSSFRKIAMEAANIPMLRQRYSDPCERSKFVHR